MNQSAGRLYMVFDVESVGLHGEGFAVGYVVVDRQGTEHDSGFFRCDPRKALGTPDGLDWVQANVAPTLDTPPTPRTISEEWGTRTPKGVRTMFWGYWEEWKEKGAILAADCPWPVEARFLADCVADRHHEREWRGPYPLIDVASVRLAAGLDPLGTEQRGPRELPVHNPLADARQSARLLIEALDRVVTARDR